jgi:hypothetical protein
VALRYGDLLGDWAGRIRHSVISVCRQTRTSPFLMGWSSSAPEDRNRGAAILHSGTAGGQMAGLV